MEAPASFGLWLQRRRQALDFTQPTLADCVGCSVATIRKIEADERRSSRQMAELLADCLQIALAERLRLELDALSNPHPCLLPNTETTQWCDEPRQW